MLPGAVGVVEAEGDEEPDDVDLPIPGAGADVAWAGPAGRGVVALAVGGPGVAPTDPEPDGTVEGGCGGRVQEPRKQEPELCDMVVGLGML